MTPLKKKIGFWAAVSVVAGSIIGSGVFMKPTSMAAQLGSPTWLLFVWIIAGIFSLVGALIYAELGAMMPQTGGLYVYFKRMFGDFFAFLYGWSAFAVINTASVAAISFVCAQYADYFLQLPRLDAATEQSLVLHIPFVGDLMPLQNLGVKLLAVVLVLGLTLLNALSLRAGSAFQVVSTFVKIVAIALLVFGIFFSGNGSTSHFVEASNPKEGGALLSGIIAAMTGAFLAYDGWINVSFIAGEVDRPQKNIPASLFIGVFTCIIVYVLTNQAYLYALPIEKIATSSLVASDAIAVAWGTTSGAIIAALIVISTLGTNNGNAMSTARVTYAMARDRSFLPWAAKQHPRFQTPANALWLHAAWITMFIITGSFDMLADMFVFITWIAYCAGAVGLFLMRRKYPEMDRPYKVWGYPVLPALFILFSAFYLVVTVYNDISNYLNNRQPVINSVLGLMLVVLGIPIYFYYRRKSAPKTQSVSNDVNDPPSS